MRPATGAPVAAGRAAFVAALVALPGLCKADADPTAAAAEIVERTNAFRDGEGLAPLERQTSLERAAADFAAFMARTGRYGHNADGRQPAQRVAAEGYEYCIVAENIAYHYRSDGFATSGALGEAFAEGWKESPEHRENMLQPDVTQTGVGVAQADDGRYFGVQLFGRPKTASVRFDVENRSGGRVVYRASDRRFSLRPRERRTHVMCGPVQLSVSRGGAESFTTRTEDGARYMITDGNVVAQPREPR